MANPHNGNLAAILLIMVLVTIFLVMYMWSWWHEYTYQPGPKPRSAYYFWLLDCLFLVLYSYPFALFPAEMCASGIGDEISNLAEGIVYRADDLDEIYDGHLGRILRKKAQIFLPSDGHRGAVLTNWAQYLSYPCPFSERRAEKGEKGDHARAKTDPKVDRRILVELYPFVY